MQLLNSEACRAKHAPLLTQLVHALWHCQYWYMDISVRQFIIIVPHISVDVQRNETADEWGN